MKPNIKVTAKQIRFVFDSGKVRMIQPLHVVGGMPEELRGYYSVPSGDKRIHGWGWHDGKQEIRILKQWIRSGFKL